MKRFLSTVLALVMVAATFTMLVTNVAAVATKAAAEPKVLYEEGFDDLNGKTPAEILKGANMKDEIVKTPESLKVEDGRLHYGVHPSSRYSTEDAYVIIKDEEALLGGYTIEYEMTFLEVDLYDDAFSFHSEDTADYSLREGRVGWVSQIRADGTSLSGAEDAKANTSSNWYNITHAAIPAVANVSADADRRKLIDRKIAVLAVFDASSDTVTTYVQDIKSNDKVAWDTSASSPQLASKSGNLSAVKSRLTNDLRLIVYGGACVELDNLTVTSADGTFTKAWDFNNVKATTPAEMLTELGWESSRNKDVDSRAMVAKDGTIVFGDSTRISNQEELILVDNVEAKDGYAIEYDVIVYNSVKTDSAHGFHSALATGSDGNASRNGVLSQLRYDTTVLNGANAGGWKEYKHGKDLMKVVFNNAANMANVHISVRMVFDPATKTVKTYAQKYTGKELTWSEENLVQTANPATYFTDAYFTQYIRLVIYEKYEMSIDNIKITSLVHKSAPDRVLFEENFSGDFSSMNAQEIADKLDWRNENKEYDSSLTVKDGRLYYGQVATPDSYLILKDNDDLVNYAYTIEYDLKFTSAGISYDAYPNQQQVLSIFATDTDDYETNHGYVGLVSQIFYNVTNSKGAAINYGVPASYYIQANNSASGLHNDTLNSAAKRLSAMLEALDKDTSKTHNNLNLGNQELTVKVEVNKAGKTLKTYVKTTGEYVLVSDTKSQLVERYFNDLRLMISPGTEVQIDNMKVTGGADGTTSLYEQNFDEISATTPSGILEAIGWTNDKATDTDSLSVKIKDGKLILKGTNDSSAQEEFILLEDSLALGGYVVEYDAYIYDSAMGGDGFGFHSAKGDFSTRLGRQGWVSQIRFDGNVLSGREENASHWDTDSGKTVLKKASWGSNANKHLAVRAVFDPYTKTVTTYVQDITNNVKGVWNDCHIVSRSGVLSSAAEQALYTNTIRLVMYGNVEMSIDNIRITTLEKMPDAFGVDQPDNAEHVVRLVGLIDQDIRQTAEEVGFSVTMTRASDGKTATKDIKCTHVYSGIKLDYNGENKLWSPGELTAGASHAYALHITGITGDATIQMTPYYVVDGIKYFGDSSRTLTYDYETDKVS